MEELFLRIWCGSASRLAQLQQWQRGATAIEYAIMVALIAAVVIAVVRAIGLGTRSNFNSLNQGL